VTSVHRPTNFTHVLLPSLNCFRVGHALYNLYSMRHWRMMNPGIARDQQVEVSAADASDIASKALKVRRIYLHAVDASRCAMQFVSSKSQQQKRCVSATC